MTEYLDFEVIGEKPKTKVFSVNSKDGIPLGKIFWHGSWRQYVFEPEEETIWSEGCLRQLAGFLTGLKME